MVRAKAMTSGGIHAVKVIRSRAALLLFLLLPASAVSQPQPISPAANARLPANVGWVGLNRSPKALLSDHRRLTAALASLKAQRKGVVDAYVVVAGLDGDAVFGREAREAGRVLARRFDAAGRTVVLAADEGKDAAPASPANLAIVLARVAEMMDRSEDALVVYTTSHGNERTGIAYRDKARGAGAITPQRYAAMLRDLGIARRLIIVSACYSGSFVRPLQSDAGVVISAAAADRPSFGCNPGNDWTYFGDALINRALRKPQRLTAAFEEARGLVAGWEAAGKLGESKPQISVGGQTARWLAAIDKRIPATATAPVGRSPAAR